VKHVALRAAVYVSSGAAATMVVIVAVVEPQTCVASPKIFSWGSSTVALVSAQVVSHDWPGRRAASDDFEPGTLECRYVSGSGGAWG
jgi:hypothetical protein